MTGATSDTIKSPTVFYKGLTDMFYEVKIMSKLPCGCGVTLAWSIEVATVVGAGFTVATLAGVLTAVSAK